MSSMHSIFRRPQPTEPRDPVDVPCLVRGQGGPHPGRVVNLCGGGLKLELSSDVPQHFLHGQLLLDLPDTGGIQVELRWRKGRNLGCAFRNRLQGRAVITQHFRHRGTHHF